MSWEPFVFWALDSWPILTLVDRAPVSELSCHFSDYSC